MTKRPFCLFILSAVAAETAMPVMAASTTKPIETPGSAFQLRTSKARKVVDVPEGHLFLGGPFGELKIAGKLRYPPMEAPRKAVRMVLLFRTK